jgi:hypothetical protein
MPEILAHGDTTMKKPSASRRNRPRRNDPRIRRVRLVVRHSGPSGSRDAVQRTTVLGYGIRSIKGTTNGGVSMGF